MFKFFASDSWYKKAAKAEEGHDTTAGSPEIAAESLSPVVVEGDDGSMYKVPLTKILNITPHGNADRLELAWVYGFQVIVKKDQYKVGDTVLYIPIDSILPQWLEDRLFPYSKDPVTGELVPPKIKLHHHRVRQIRIRKIASQGMLIDMNDIQKDIEKLSGALVLEKDYAKWLDITKYEPPAAGPSSTMGAGRNRNKKHEHPLFHKYNGLSNIKWFPTFFAEGETEVVLQEKLHGTNARASILPYIATTPWKKFLKFLKLTPAVEHCYGSNNVQKSVATNAKHFYESDVWGDCFKALDVFSKLKVGEIVYGEIVGPGIQSNYDYGLNEHRFVVFDVKTLQADGKLKWLAPDAVEEFCKERGFEYVPVLYKGKYYRDLTLSFTKGASVYCPKQKVREGIVIKDATTYNDAVGNKRALKWVSEDYLADDTNTDNH